MYFACGFHSHSIISLSKCLRGEVQLLAGEVEGLGVEVSRLERPQPHHFLERRVIKLLLMLLVLISHIVRWPLHFEFPPTPLLYAMTEVKPRG